MIGLEFDHRMNFINGTNKDKTVYNYQTVINENENFIKD